jgi:hypothetical protein
MGDGGVTKLLAPASRGAQFGPEGSQHEKLRAAARFSCGNFNEARRSNGAARPSQ